MYKFEKNFAEFCIIDHLIPEYLARMPYCLPITTSGKVF